MIEGGLRSIGRLVGATAAALLVVAAAGATTSSAAPEPELECGSACARWWHLSYQLLPERLPAGGEGEIRLLAENFGDEGTSASSPVVVKERLPAGLTALSAQGCEVLAQEVTCKSQQVRSFGNYEVNVRVAVAPSAQSGETIAASISGGEAAGASMSRAIAVGAEPVPFGVEAYELRPENADGSPDTQAGSHPFQLTTDIAFNQTAHPASPPAAAKDLRFNLPPGLIGNPTPFPQCPLKAFLRKTPYGEDECPDDTAIGVASVTYDVNGEVGQGGRAGTETVPLFALEPSIGEPARFGFYILGVATYLDTSIRAGGDYGVTVTVPNITELIGFLSSRVTFWGVPGDPRHDPSRGWNCLDPIENQQPCAHTEQKAPPPLLTLPTSCTGPVSTTVEGDSWLAEGAFTPPFEYVFKDNLGRPIGMDGCNQEPFSPSIKVTPDGQAGSTPTGLTVDEHVPQQVSLNPTGLAEAGVKGLSVTLPEGVALNPAGADGLLACSMEAIALESGNASSCPEAAKVATVKIKTPLLPNALEGAAYLATQSANPFGSLVALYVEAYDPVSGVRAKATGEVREDPVTGQLTSYFEEDPVFAGDPRFAGDLAARFLPQTPFEDIELHFFGGSRAPLATPAKCGGYTTTGTFTPWSGNATTESSSTFDIVSGPNGSPCRDPLPFGPSLTAGATSVQAGGLTPFVMTMSREDGEQSLRGITLQMPPGLSGVLAGVKLCPEAQANAGTCGPESQIGETIVSVGVGASPFTVTGGRVYITGPYKGAPFGLSIVNPAKAGPFDLGQVVVRAKIDVNDETTALTITTDNEGPYKIPTIIDGIPLEIKHVFVDINRPGFTFNATNCNPLAVGGELASAEGSFSALSVPYQVTNCAALAFKPKLEASTSAKTSRVNGASLTVKLSYPSTPYNANIARVKVELPRALPSRLTTLQKGCTAATFDANPANCSPDSVVGHATATTPVLPVPLSGPAYFVSHGGEAFPSLVIVLQGYGVTVHLVGSTFINKAGITSSTFKTVPDVPVGSFELTLPEGRFSALGAIRDLCKTKLAMPTEFVGQDGALIKTSTKIAVTGCPKARRARHTRRRARTKPRRGVRRGKRK